MNESALEPATASKKWLSKSEIAAHLGVDKRTIGNWMRRRVLPYVKVRGVLRFDRFECEEALRRFRTRPITEKKQQSTNTAEAGRENDLGSVPPPMSSANAALLGQPITAQGTFVDRATLRKTLAELDSRLSAAPPGGAWRWLLVIVPEPPEPLLPKH